MIRQTRAELLKLRSTRTTLGLVLGMLALVLLFSLLTALVTKVPHLSSKEDQRGLLAVGSLAGLFSALAGALLVTSEYRYGTIRPTFLFTPRRPQVIAAKVAAAVLAGLLFAVLAEAISLPIGLIVLSSRGIPISLSGGEVVALALGTLAGVALWGAIGVGVGAVVSNQVGAVVGLLAWGFVVENLLFGLVPAVGRFTPGKAQDALIGMTTEHLLAPALGGVLLLAWALALAYAGVVQATRRDVS